MGRRVMPDPAPPRRRWGIAGTGTMALTMVATLATVPAAEVVAIGSRSRERADEVSTRTGVARGHASYDALVEDPEVDVVYVATADEHHVEVACAALAAGKHVLVEKPFALDAAGARAVVAAAAAADRFCMEAMWTRFLPAVDRLLVRAEHGEIGEPRLLVASLGFTQTRPAASALLDLGVYPVSMAHLLLGPPTAVTASHLDPGLAVLTLTHAGGAVSQLSASSALHLDNTLVLTGRNGRLTLPAPMLHPDEVVQEHLEEVAPPQEPHGRSVTDRLREVPGVRLAAAPVRAVARRAGGRTHRDRAPYLGNGYVHEVYAVHRLIAEGALESERMPLADSVAVLETLDAVRALGDGAR